MELSAALRHTPKGVTCSLLLPKRQSLPTPVDVDGSVAAAAGAPSARGRPSMPRSYRRLVLCALGALCVVGPTALGVVAAPAPALRPRKIDQAPRPVSLDDRLRPQRRQEVASSAQSSTTASIDGSLSASSSASSAALEPEPTAAGPLLGSALPDSRSLKHIGLASRID